MGAASSSTAWWCHKHDLSRSGAVKDVTFFADGDHIQKQEDECICQHSGQAGSSCASTASGGFSFCSNESTADDFTRTFDHVVLNLDVEVGGLVDDVRHEQFLVEFATNLRSPLGPTEPVAFVMWEPVTRRLFDQIGESPEDCQAFHSSADVSPGPLACQLGLSSPAGRHFDASSSKPQIELLAEQSGAFCGRLPLEHCLPSAIQRWKQKVLGAASPSPPGPAAVLPAGAGESCFGEGGSSGSRSSGGSGGGLAVPSELLRPGLDWCKVEKLVEDLHARLLTLGPLPRSWNGAQIRQRLLRAVLAAPAGRVVSASSSFCEKILSGIEPLREAALAAESCGLGDARRDFEDFSHFAAYSQLVDFHPLAAVSEDGHPVSICLLKRQVNSVSGIGVKEVSELFRDVDHCLDCFLAERSEELGRMLVAIAIFDLSGLVLWHLASIWRLVLKPAAFSSACPRFQVYLVNVPWLLLPFLHLAVWAFVGQRAWPLVTISSSVPSSLRSRFAASSLPISETSWPD